MSSLPPSSQTTIALPGAALLRPVIGMAAAEDLDTALEMACAAACELAGGTHAVVVLLVPDGASGRVAAECPRRGMLGRVLSIHDVPALKRLVSSRRPLRLNVGNDDGLAGARELLDEIGIRALLAVPVTRGDRLLGWLSVHATDTAHELSPDASEMCAGLAHAVALTVEHARMMDESRARTAELESLRRASKAITSLLELDDQDRDALLHRIIHEAVTALGAHSGGIYRYAPDLRELTLLADYRRPGHRGKTLLLGEGMAGSLVESGEPYLAEPNYRAYAQRARVFDQNDGPTGFGAVLEVPLRWHGQVTGVLYIDDAVGREFRAEDAARLGILADQAALVLANAELRREEQALAAPAFPDDTLLQATHRILRNPGITTLDDRLAMIAHEAARVLNAELCQVLLVRRPGVLTLEASWGHREGTFDKGRLFEIRSGPRSGLTGHIANEMKVFRAHGDRLTGHFAVRGLRIDHLESRKCCSLLAIPLLKDNPEETQPLLGLLRVENKKDAAGRASPELGFDETDEQNGQLFAQVVVTAIENEALVRQLREQAEADARRQELLTRMFEIRKELHAEIDTGQLRQEVPRRALELFGYEAACLYDCDLEQREMVVVGVAGLPPAARGDRQPVAAGLPGRVAQLEMAVRSDESGYTVAGQSFELAIGAPLRRAGGTVASVLVIAGTAERARFAEIDREILDLFAAQAATLLQGSILWNWQRRGFVRSTAMGRIEEFIRRTRDTEHILAALLTGMTAGYGLGFNRAAVFLFGEDRRSVEGRLGIGYHTETEARKAWERHHEDGMENVARYLERLEEHGHVETPLNARVRQVRVTDASELMLLLTAVDEGRLVIDEPEMLAAFPEEIVEAFAPRLPLILVPLAVGTEILGLVLADTAFARTRASLEDLDGAVKLSATAAAALVDVPGPWTQLHTERLATLDGLHTAAAGMPDAEGDALDAVYQQIVSAARYVFDARSAVLWSYDAPTRSFSLRQCAGDIDANLRTRLQQQPPREGQTAFTVLERGWLPVHDVESADYSSFLSAGTRDILRDIGARSFQGVALTVAHEQLGVVYINYAEPRSFAPENMWAAAQFAEHASLALKQAQMLDQVNRARRTARVLARVATLSSVDDLGSTLRTVAGEMLKALGCGAVTLYEYDPERGFLNPPTDAGVLNPVPLAAHAQVPRDWFLYRLMQLDQPHIIDDAATDPDLGPSRFRREEGIRSCVVVPLRVRKQPVGLMFVNYRTPHRFTTDELYNIEHFADQAAVVIHSSQLYRQRERSLKEQQAQIAWGTVGIIDRHWGHKLRRYVPNIQAWGEVARGELDAALKRELVDAELAARWRELLDRFLDHTATVLSRRPLNGPPGEGVVTVRVNEFMRKALKTWKGRDTQLSLPRFETGEDDAIRANPEWLQAALDTLVDNAVEAMQGSAHKELSVTTRRSDDNIQIELSDTGCGIDPEQRERYFTDPLSMKGKGMGVGLTIVRGIAETYFGTVAFVDTGPDTKGATVRLTLPCARADQPGAGAALEGGGS